MDTLPWRPSYAQYSGDNESMETSTTVMETYAVALTILFTVFVFALEHVLDQRQANAYKQTEFPKQLEVSVSKIDAEQKKKQKGNGDAATTAKDNNDDEKTKNKEESSSNKKEGVDTSKPILPQLQEKFTKSQLYGLDKINFAMFSATYGVAESVTFLMLGYLPYIWDTSVALGERWFDLNESDNEIKVTLIFLLVTTIIGMITGLPFELYSTFHIEKKHGFCNQTIGLFVSDKIKSLVLTCFIGTPFVVALLKIIKWGGEYFYIYVWAFLFVFSIAMMTIVPVFIMPLFNKYTPLPDSDLKKRIVSLADSIKYPLQKLFVMDGSKRSSHSNAFLFGFGSNKRIVLFDTLMDQVDDDEILAILGHELGHWKLGHSLISLAVTQLYFGAAFYCFSLCYNSTDLYHAFGFEGGEGRPVPTIIALLLFFETIWAPIDKILSFATTILSRCNEFQADRFSADLGMAAKLQTGLCKISLENLGAMCPDPWYAMYHYSHPPLVERLSAMMDFEKKME